MMDLMNVTKGLNKQEVEVCRLCATGPWRARFPMSACAGWRTSSKATARRSSTRDRAISEFVALLHRYDRQNAAVEAELAKP